MLIDTHCHLDAASFAADRSAVVQRARQAGVALIVIPAVSLDNFAAVRQLAHANPDMAYALGIHPLFVAQAPQDAIAGLAQVLEQARHDPKLVAIGEIGLDFFVAEHASALGRHKQEEFFAAQLDLAVRYELPVLLHLRRAQDIILKHLRKRAHIGGIAHAFNGSFQQAEQFIKLGFALGVGGAFTFKRALQIRRLVSQLALEHLVLETDAPDMAPEWLRHKNADADAGQARNEPAELARIASAVAQLRNIEYAQVLEQTACNASRVLPRLLQLDPYKPYMRN